MGMIEMEEAVEVMVNKAISSGVKFGDVVVMTEEFMGRAATVTGLCHLCMNGWLRRGNYNSTFIPENGLVERVVRRFPELA